MPPFDREQTLALALALDDMIDLVEEVADKLAIYHLARPPKGAADQAALLRRACAVIVEAVDDLERPSELRQYAVRLDEIAKKADSLFRRRMRRLFDDGNDVRSVLTGKDIYRGLKSAIDRADAVGRVLDGIALNW